ncbi:hypothetical protein ACNPNN_11730 [Stenotrophomonas geniculata]|uniref:hypothetical protein n=1 Tax=Stenotrophomonas geniculata TaxID=86188 RepID=UPI003AAF7FBE
MPEKKAPEYRGQPDENGKRKKYEKLLFGTCNSLDHRWRVYSYSAAARTATTAGTATNPSTTTTATAATTAATATTCGGREDVRHFLAGVELFTAPSVLNTGNAIADGNDIAYQNSVGP